jgi:hypothetical protein
VSTYPESGVKVSIGGVSLSLPFFFDLFDVFRNEFDFLDQTRNFCQFVSEDDRVDSTNDRRFQVKMKCFHQIDICKTGND